MNELLDIQPEKIVTFEPSEETQDRVQLLMDKHYDATITPAEQAELDYYIEFEHTVRLMKARAAQILAMRAA